MDGLYELIEFTEGRSILENAFSTLLKEVSLSRNSPNENQTTSLLSMMSLIREMQCFGYECSNLYEKVFTLLNEIYMQNLRDGAIVKFLLISLFSILGNVNFLAGHLSLWDTKDFHREVPPDMQLFYLRGSTYTKITITGGYRIGDFFASCYANARFLIPDSFEVNSLQCEYPTLSIILSFGLTSGLPSRLCCHPLHDHLAVDILVRLLECYYHSSGLCPANCFSCETQTAQRETFKATAKEVYGDCVRLLVRALPPFSMMHLFRACNKRNKTLNDVATAFDTLAVFLPQLPDRVTGCGVSSLQHLCRCEVRRRLFDNWSLPSGIQQLPLSVWMKDYIDLKYD